MKSYIILSSFIILWVSCFIMVIKYDHPPKKNYGETNCIDLDAIDRNNDRIEAILINKAKL